MWTSIKNTTLTAKKNYNCDACGQLLESGIVNSKGQIIDEWLTEKLTQLEIEAIQKAHENNWCIVKGQRYNYQFNTDGGDACVWRTIPEIDDIMIRHGLYLED